MVDVKPKDVQRRKRSGDEQERLNKKPRVKETQGRAKSEPQANLSSLPRELKDLVAVEFVKSYLESGTNQDMRNVLSLREVSFGWSKAVDAQFQFKQIHKLNRRAAELADKIYELSAADKQKYGSYDFVGLRPTLARQNGPNAGLLKQSVRDKIANDILHQKDEFDQARDIFAWAPYMDQMDGSNRHRLLSKAVDIYAETSPTTGQGKKLSFASRGAAAGALQIAHEFLTVDQKEKIKNVIERSDLDNDAFNTSAGDARRVLQQLGGHNGLIKYHFRTKETSRYFSEYFDKTIQKFRDLDNEAVSPEREDKRAKIVTRFAVAVKTACHDLSDPSEASALEGIYSKATFFAKQIYRETKYEAENGGSLADRAKQIAPIAGYLEHAERGEISRDILAEKDKIAQASALAGLASGLREFEDTYRKPLLDRAAELFAAPRPSKNEASSSESTSKVPYTKAAVALQIGVSHLTDEQKASIQQTCSESVYHREIFTRAFSETEAVVEEWEGQRGVRDHPYRGIEPVAKLAKDLLNFNLHKTLPPNDLELPRYLKGDADMVSRVRNNARSQLLAQSRERSERDVGR